ncbi:MAG: agmatine deiminase family protein [Rhodopirellula sp.]|nr:agmatine deiminase family protein [Rhodopirellula sp.]
MQQTPARLGYRMPAEWEPHAATWLSWPRNRDTWPGKFEPIPAVWEEMARTIAAVEPVHILAGGEEVLRQAESMVGDVPNITIHDIPTNDVWIRDHGPTFLVGRPDAPPALVNWTYNAWGGKYPPFDLDNLVPKQIAKLQGRLEFEPQVVFEGGAIDVNGQGTVLAAEQCLLDPNRNPNLTRSQVEWYLAEYLGASKIVWLRADIAGDDTDGHVDQSARFVGPRTVVAAWEENPDDANFDSLQANFGRLRETTDHDGRPLDVVPLPMPQPMYYQEQRLPASYANFYIANGLVVVPQYGDPADHRAVRILSELFPDREIRGLNAVDLVWGLGAYHCATQQEPA